MINFASLYSQALHRESEEARQKRLGAAKLEQRREWSRGHLERIHPKTAFGREFWRYYAPLMNSGYDDRFRLMLELLEQRNPSRDVFWEVIQCFWQLAVNSNYATWSEADRDRLLVLMRMHQRPDHGPPLRVYRGCERGRVLAIPWSTEQYIAEKYAMARDISIPVVAMATIPADGIFLRMVTGDIGETLLDPFKLQGLTVHAVP